jgi:hypothetical protein
MCYEYRSWAWKARAAELAKKERKVPESQPKRGESQPEPAAETPPRQREPVPA